MNTKRLIIGAAALFGMSRMLLGAITPISPAELQAGITNQSYTHDFILIDVRDNSEVADGIIATQYCKPYHMSWNTGKFDSSFQLLPKTAWIIIYCRSGNRSNQAASKLSDAGYEKVFSMTGGYNSYQGEKVDSTNFKPLSKLPEASYVEKLAVVARPNGTRYAITTPASELPRQQFTLQGRVVRKIGPQQPRNATVYILERIGDNASGKIEGLHRLVQER